LGFAIEDQSPRALVLAALRFLWNKPPEEIEAWTAEPHGPGTLTAAERSLLDRPQVPAGPAYVKGDIPDWLLSSFERAFGERAAGEGAALAARAPIDLRVNTLKADRPKLIAAM